MVFIDRGVYLYPITCNASAMPRDNLMHAPDIGIRIDRAHGGGGPPTKWSGFSPDEMDAVVLFQTSGFVREAEGMASYLDLVTGYVNIAGTEERFADPLGRNWVYTAIIFEPGSFADRFSGPSRHDWTLRVSAQADLRHRKLLRALLRGTDRLEVEERLYRLFDTLTSSRPARKAFTGTSTATRVVHRRLALAVQEALNAGYLTTNLEDLARMVGASPKHLSKVFHAVTGRTITDYRNDLRVRAVLNDLTAGGDCLADLAARYGFADHAHLTRTVRKHVGEAPSTLREALSG
ncbi:helix-turn-helix domain-containing protein [Streptosporangium sp. NPDC001559]|uniref:helix-turn-helix domain-containing protein n=1 Tax=Streptosporangium sp. NPDC001559 TaxID=3366187 RepID=UPI0036E4E53C